MKKIKDKIKIVYNRYLTFIRDSIIKKIKKIQLISPIKKALTNFVTLSFLYSDKTKIGVLSRYIILLILLLFSYLFYLSIPTLYNYGEIQKDLNKKLLNEFNLNTSLSANITYKILPSPNFEITNVLLTTGSKNKFEDFAEIKKMNIFVYVKNLHNKDKIQIKKISISEANININKTSYEYINSYLKNRISEKKIQIQKSKIFFRENNPTKDAITLATIKKLNLFHDKEKSFNQINIKGLIYNTRYDLTLLKKTNAKDETNIQIQLDNISTRIKSKFYKDANNKNTYNGNIIINLPGSEISTKYKIVGDLISFKSEKSNLRSNKISHNGIINISPFYYNINLNLEHLNVSKFLKNISNLKNLLDDKILLSNKLNGKLFFNVSSLKGIKFFDEAKIKIINVNGKLLLNNSSFKSNKIGEMIINDSTIEIIDDRKIFKSKILFKLNDQKKFYQKLQIPKSNRIKLSNIYFEIEKDIDIDDFIITKIIFNKKVQNTVSEKSLDLSDYINISEVSSIKNWIGIKKFSSNVFDVIKKTN